MQLAFRFALFTTLWPTILRIVWSALNER
jgi:hypothetical protein